MLILNKNTEQCKMARSRKARNDRNHIIYVIECVVTKEQYIGVTVKDGTLKKAIKVRMQKHLQRAKNENKDWTLCKMLRQYPVECFTVGVLEVVRGKLAAHKRELELIRACNSALNTFA